MSRAGSPLAPKALPPLSYVLLKRHSNGETQLRDQTAVPVILMKKSGKKTDGALPHLAPVPHVWTSLLSAGSPLAPKALPPLSYVLLKRHSNGESQLRDQTAARTVLSKKSGKKTDGAPPHSAPV